VRVEGRTGRASSAVTKRYYPAGLDLAGKPVLVVGGGAIAEGKIEQLVEVEADVRVVSPEVTPRIAELAAAGRVRWERRPFTLTDVDGAWIAIGATDDRAVNAAVADAARAAGRLVNAVDDVPKCDFIAMSLVRRGELQVAVSTGGGSPALARWVREELEELLPEEFGALLDILADVRRRLRAEKRVPRYETWRRAITPRVLALLRAGQRDAARRALLAALRPRGGTVHLVGAGPGDPELITVKGAQALARADAVVYDHLVDERLLDLAPAHAERIYVGKRPGRHHLPQGQIDALLVELARQGKAVVRLKGGDPFVFGRGGEEAAALAAAGVPCEVVPGVSSAIAGPGAAGIPLTHRGCASAFVVVTGHCAAGNEAGSSTGGVAWDALARSGATLVILMGMRHLAEIARRLIAAGRPADEPVAVVQNATRPDQRTLVATLADVAERVAEAGIGSPAAIVVGPVVALRARRSTERILEAAFA
jgi:uroporphyrin-III C-methyltransferase/precorrin-2 dehydrogenase/sirohydrochlorin ferrochelatase